MKKILVLRGGALGDFIVTLPALRSLRQRWPAAQIELAGNATAAQLGRRRGLLDAVHSQHEARWSALYGGGQLPVDFAEWLREFDLVVNYWPDPEQALRRAFPLRADQTFLSTSALPTVAPAAAHYCAPLRDLGIVTTDYFYPLGPDSAGPASESRTRTIVVHPGSGSPRKNWPRANWQQLVRQLPPPVSVVLGEAELEREGGSMSARDAWIAQTGREIETESSRERRPHESEEKRASAPAATFLLNRPLEELVVHLSRCRLFLGHDSGISHLAAACGARCVLLFGPTDPAMWAPPAATVCVVRRAPDLASIAVADVQQAVTAALADQT